MLIKTLLNVAFRINHVYYLIYLVRECIAERNNFIVLTHFMKKVLWVWPKNKTFWLFSPMTKQFYHINYQCVLFLYCCRKVRIRSNSQKGYHVPEIRNTQIEWKVLKNLIEGLLKWSFIYQLYRLFQVFVKHILILWQLINWINENIIIVS